MLCFERFRLTHTNNNKKSNSHIGISLMIRVAVLLCNGLAGGLVHCGAFGCHENSHCGIFHLIIERKMMKKKKFGFRNEEITGV